MDTLLDKLPPYVLARFDAEDIEHIWRALKKLLGAVAIKVYVYTLEEARFSEKDFLAKYDFYYDILTERMDYFEMPANCLASKCSFSGIAAFHAMMMILFSQPVPQVIEYCKQLFSMEV